MGKIIGDGITFDDVLLVPGYSEVIPNQVDLSTHLTKEIKLNIPVMSAGMEFWLQGLMGIVFSSLLEVRRLGRTSFLKERRLIGLPQTILIVLVKLRLLFLWISMMIITKPY